MSDTSTSAEQPNAQTSGADSVDKETAGSRPDTGAQADFVKALEYLQMLGVDADDGKRALEATTAHQPSDVIRWADEAALWLACVNEVDMEQRAMGTAMQESLDEAESRKQLEKPVHEQTEEQLKLRYDRSYILKQLARGAGTTLPTLWEPPNRQYLLPLLELELKACKWYQRQGTRIYLEQLGQACALQLCPPKSVTSTCCATPGYDLKPKNCGSVNQAQSQRCPDIAAVLSEQLHKLQHVLYTMPEVPGAVPTAFIEVEPVEDIEGVDAVSDRPSKRHCPGDCVDLL